MGINFCTCVYGHHIDGTDVFKLNNVNNSVSSITILKTELGEKLTIEEIAERVGYNSKSAFNTAFKKITSQTPSVFRNA